MSNDKPYDKKEIITAAYTVGVTERKVLAALANASYEYARRVATQIEAGELDPYSIINDEMVAWVEDEHEAMLEAQDSIEETQTDLSRAIHRQQTALRLPDDLQKWLRERFSATSNDEAIRMALNHLRWLESRERDE